MRLLTASGGWTERLVGLMAKKASRPWLVFRPLSVISSIPMSCRVVCLAFASFFLLIFSHSYPLMDYTAPRRRSAAPGGKYRIA